MRISCSNIYNMLFKILRQAAFPIQIKRQNMFVCVTTLNIWIYDDSASFSYCYKPRIFKSILNWKKNYLLFYERKKSYNRNYCIFKEEILQIMIFVCEVMRQGAGSCKQLEFPIFLIAKKRDYLHNSSYILNIFCIKYASECSVRFYFCFFHRTNYYYITIVQRNQLIKQEIVSIYLLIHM